MCYGSLMDTDTTPTIADLQPGQVILFTLHRDEPFALTVVSAEPTGSVKFGQVGPNATPIMRVTFTGMPRPFTGTMELAADQKVTLASTEDDPRTCDSCGQAVTADGNGYWVGEDETSDCPRSPMGHTYLDTVNVGELP